MRSQQTAAQLVHNKYYLGKYTHPQELRVMAAVEELAGMFGSEN